MFNNNVFKVSVDTKKWIKSACVRALKTFAQSMGAIEESVNTLADTIAQIAEALNGINATVNEANIGVTDIADKTTDVVEQTVQNNELVEDCIGSVEKLHAIAAMFTLD